MEQRNDLLKNMVPEVGIEPTWAQGRGDFEGIGRGWRKLLETLRNLFNLLSLLKKITMTECDRWVDTIWTQMGGFLRWDESAVRAVVNAVKWEMSYPA